MLLAGRNAIIYGGGGAIGGGVARAFAAEGARVFLAGRTGSHLAAVASEITAAGGQAEVAEVDALDERAVDGHAASVAAAAGSIDVSFNLIARGDVQGIALADMTPADFTRPIITGLTSTFITARAAVRQMMTQGSGVVLTLNSGSAHGSTMMGGTGPADAAADTFIRNLAAEVGPHGIRVLGLWAAGIPDTLSPAKLAAVNGDLRLDDVLFQRLLAQLDQMRMTRHSPRLADIARVAVFLASDQAAGMTGTMVNVTGGMFPS
jgi:NAD(P)-dependent dehydrogenase (short-subunit alcohol dehydrogenase family)